MGSNPNNNNVSQGNVIHVSEGNTFTLTKEMIFLLQNPKRVPTRGGLPFILVLKKGRHCKYGPNRGLVPTYKANRGLVVFLPDHGLNVGEEFIFVWTTDHAAAAVPLSQREEYLAVYQPEMAETS